MRRDLGGGVADPAMMFFTGMHHPHNAAKVPAAFISAHAVIKRRSGFPVRRCILDSGAFTTIFAHGGYPDPVEVYAALIRRVRYWLGNRLLAVVSQDFMCERIMCARVLGLPIETLPKKGRAREVALVQMLPDEQWATQIVEHQRLTIERYDALMKCDVAGARIIPVLQGYKPSDYVRHIAMYGKRLAHRAWVGVGSVCKRNANPAAVEAVLLAIKRVRPDLRLHGFGVKLTALVSQLVRKLLFSADSMAWSFAARYEGRDGNDPAEAVRYTRRIATMPVQLHLLHEEMA